MLTPDISETKVAVRGFHVKDPAAKDLLETVGSSFLEGYAYAAEASRTADALASLERMPTRFKGFAYEGAAMGFAVRDGLPFGGGQTKKFLAGPGDRHVYMAYVGVGWAMARLPRFRWSAMHAPDPLLHWLLMDGYGFHQAYFRTQRYVHEQYRETGFPYPASGSHPYTDHAIDQGIGRALWFVGGTDVKCVKQLLDRFPAHRHADLYSGVGLAATYAGGVDRAELRELRRVSGKLYPHLAQGAAFAASARERAGLIVAHNELAAEVLCGMSVVEAAAICDLSRPGEDVPGDVPAYEIWRRRIRQEFGAEE
ncbi:DUF1702 family protein [Winogradskya consettensis]|uniref:Enediyne biosynthesis protein n=1 Tax=Winogradskya consettensis TaxID=113560 RepID=A0A919VWG7_9ACTN|nr:enediyne biosynthesis protein [Actinoplanes consettensis]